MLPLIPLVSKIAGLPQMIELLRGVKRPIQGLSLGGRVSKAISVCETKSKGVDRRWSVRLFPAVARSVSTTDFNRVISDLKSD